MTGRVARANLCKVRTYRFSYLSLFPILIPKGKTSGKNRRSYLLCAFLFAEEQPHQKAHEAAEGKADGRGDHVPYTVDEGGTVVPDGDGGQEQHCHGKRPRVFQLVSRCRAQKRAEQERGAEDEQENIEHIELQRQSQRFLPIFFHGGILLRVFFYYTRAGNAFQERGREVPVDGFAVLWYYFFRNTRKNCGSFR